MKALTNFVEFLKGVREEMKQVTWPTRTELLGSALVVLVGVAIMAIYISVCDLMVSKAAALLLR